MHVIFRFHRNQIHFHHHNTLRYSDLLSCHDDSHSHSHDHRVPSGNFSYSCDIVLRNDLHSLGDEVDMVLVDMDVEGMVLVDMVLDGRCSDIHNGGHCWHSCLNFRRNYFGLRLHAPQHKVIHFDSG